MILTITVPPSHPVLATIDDLAYLAQVPDRPNDPPDQDDENEEDEVPSTPPTEPPPTPIEDPLPKGQPPGPYISRGR